MSNVIDGSICTDLYTEDGGREWHMIQREGGSISLYYTYTNSSGMHYVVHDTLDDTPASEYAQSALTRLADLHAAIGALLTAIKGANLCSL